jgi:solute:Na+ symporter, SSS family
VFSFVNAPLFATFLLGMFWKRATGHGAFWGLLGGILGAATFQGMSMTAGQPIGVLKGGWLAQMLSAHPFTYNSEMGQTLWIAIVAWTSCFVLTIAISLATARNKTDEQLKGLVYSLTAKPETAHEPWYKRPVTVGILVLAVTALLNIIFW